ncbi:uncharacterized protein LOC34622503 [Cyclospora cayetanensis]|uniref:Uncharacterized protein LOC34622503 n=1 Tax=Cyclospora cayetanensis TaxID=88456 RepID=A0A6P6RY56_9EIME|nr:uncharacterized protein LOC34622503 [Cyclospora cayetanensis]
MEGRQSLHSGVLACACVCCLCVYGSVWLGIGCYREGLAEVPRKREDTAGRAVAQVLRNEAACVVQSYFRGYLLRRVLREELETTVIRWTDAPLGKKHEAEVSVCEPPHWRKKLSMHFCPLRKAYTCPVQIVKGRLRVQLLVDGRPFPPHRSLKKTASEDDTHGVLLLPGVSLGQRIAPRFPWRAARHWLQQQRPPQQLKQLEGHQRKNHEHQQRKQQLAQVRQVHPATERDTQAWVESGSLGGPLRNPRLPAGGLLGTSEVKGIFGRTADCSPGSHRWSCDTDTQEEPPSSDTSSSHVWLWSNSSNGDEELSPLQRGPSWASGSHRSMGQQRRVPVKWMQQQHQEQKEQQGGEQAQGEQERHQQPNSNLRGLRTRKSISTLDSDGHESPSSANESTGESAAALGEDPSRWKPSAEREPFDAPTFHTTCIQTALGRDREGAEWWGPREEDYPWSSWPWSLSVSPQTKASEAPPVVSGFQRDCRHFSGWSSLAPFTPARGARNCSNGGSGAMPPSHAWALQGSLGPPRKCREALMESADLTGALLWARKRSHRHRVQIALLNGNAATLVGAVAPSPSAAGAAASAASGVVQTEAVASAVSAASEAL